MHGDLPAPTLGLSPNPITPEPPVDTFSCLPTNVFTHIFEFLTNRGDLVRASSVSKLFNSILARILYKSVTIAYCEADGFYNWSHFHASERQRRLTRTIVARPELGAFTHSLIVQYMPDDSALSLTMCMAELYNRSRAPSMSDCQRHISETFNNITVAEDYCIAQ